MFFKIGLQFDHFKSVEQKCGGFSHFICVAHLRTADFK